VGALVVANKPKFSPGGLRCLYCDKPLSCALCGKLIVFRSRQEHDAFFEPESPVRCPYCNHTLRCRYCGAVYSGAEEEYE